MICVIGLGYVGLPLAQALSKAGFEVIGYDTDGTKVDKLRGTTDFFVTCSTDDFHTLSIDTYIVCVPTPVHRDKTPELDYLEAACTMLSSRVKPGDLVVFESTVYPGCTENFCWPILTTKCSQIHLGYSPERINPGDTEHTIDKVTKIIAASSFEGMARMHKMYGAITTVHHAPTIRVAEAAKIIENVQRDVNIALINEFTMLLHEMDIDTKAVLDAARTKWNWLNFRPGLVGGHCIGVDPYYLTNAAQRIGFHSEMILAGRRTNDGMPKYVAIEIAKRMRTGSILILGTTFKADVGDFRNSKVNDLSKELEKFDFEVFAIDPNCLDVSEAFSSLADFDHMQHEFNAVIYAVDHKEFAPYKGRLRELVCTGGQIFDLTGTLVDCSWSL